MIVWQMPFYRSPIITTLYNECSPSIDRSLGIVLNLVVYGEFNVIILRHAIRLYLLLLLPLCWSKGSFWTKMDGWIWVCLVAAPRDTNPRLSWALKCPLIVSLALERSRPRNKIKQSAYLLFNWRLFPYLPRLSWHF